MNPKIYVCLDLHFDHEQGKKLGYSYQTEFLAGKAKDSKDATWHGKEKELKTINDTLKVLYNDDYANINFTGFDQFDGVEEIPSQGKFILPYGYCLLLNQKRAYKFLYMTTQTKIRIVLVDPYSVNSVVLKESALVDVGPTNHDGHSYDLFKAKFVIYDQVS